MKTGTLSQWVEKDDGEKLGYGRENISGRKTKGLVVVNPTHGYVGDTAVSTTPLTMVCHNLIRFLP